MRNNPTSNHFIFAILFTTLLLLGKREFVNAQADLDWNGTRLMTANVDIMTDFGANPNDLADDTWAFVKLSKWLNNQWDRDGHPYLLANNVINNAADQNHKINYTLNYVTVEFPPSTPGYAYLVGKEVEVNSVDAGYYSITNLIVPQPPNSPEIPFKKIFGNIVPGDNTEGMKITVLKEFINHDGDPNSVQYSTVYWQAVPLIDVEGNDVDGIWFKGQANTRIKKNAGLHLGYWDKDGQAFAQPSSWNGAANTWYENGYWGMQQSGGNHFFSFDGIINIKFSDIEIDGNKQTLTLGGVHPTESLQSGTIGIRFKNTKQISMDISLKLTPSFHSKLTPHLQLLFSDLRYPDFSLRGQS